MRTISLIASLSILSGCATYSQMMFGPNNEIQQCSMTGQGLVGMSAAFSAKSSCVNNLVMVGYRRIEEVGVIGVTYDGTSINYVKPGGPAEAANLVMGDIVTHVDGESIETAEELRDRMRALPMTIVTLDVDRNGERLTFTLQRTPYTTLYGATAE